MSKKTIAITGVNGFVGQHLTKMLLDEAHAVVGIGRDKGSGTIPLNKYISCDLAKTWPELHTPVDAVIHLAGLAAVGPSFDDPQSYLNLNSAMVTNMCEYYLGQDKKPRIVIVSSGAVYDPAQNMPISEASAVAFNSPYAVSKILTENQAAYYNARGLECIVMRPFNHIGPGQMPGFIVPDLFKKIRERTSKCSPITSGNLTSKRDYTDVRDVARAYMLVATATDTPRELIYNVCSGESHSGNEVLSAVTEALGILEPEVSVDTDLLRPNDIQDIRGDNTKLKNEFGWEPSFAFEQSINDFVRAAQK
jgi:GDP-4-dehydro-6-deoxy-D-mannose reductase